MKISDEGIALIKGAKTQHITSLDIGGPDVVTYRDLMRVMAEELRHGYQMLHLLVEQDWSQVSGQKAEEIVEEILSMKTGSHVLDAFNVALQKGRADYNIARRLAIASPRPQRTASSTASAPMTCR